MEAKKEETIEKIYRLTLQDAEFDAALRKKLGIATPGTETSVAASMQKDVKAIRETLNIRADPSISYGFIKNQRLRDQLVIDNLRMENAALDLNEKELYRFYTFCLNAFYQIENLLNYYYFKTYPKIEDLQQAIEDGTSQETENFRFHKNEHIKTVGDIQISHKINAFCNTFFSQKTKMTYVWLRKVRNEGEHRCMAATENQEKEESIYKFFKSNTFNSIRTPLKNLADTVRQQTANKEI